MVSGCVAIIFALRPDAAPAGMDHYLWSCIFIGLAAVADFLDGFMARLLRAYSSLGKELDSLCDAVSFGVVPGMLTWSALTDSGASPVVALSAIIIPVAAAVRLGRFNIDDRQTTSFIGLPVPANAIFWIGFTAMMRDGMTLLASPCVIIPVIVAMAWLMNSPLRIFSLKFKSFGWKGNASRWIIIIAAPVLLIILGLPGLMWLILLYMLMSIAIPEKN